MTTNTTLLMREDAADEAQANLAEGHDALVLERLARLERMYDGPIPAPLRKWALEGKSDGKRS